MLRLGLLYIATTLAMIVAVYGVDLALRVFKIPPTEKNVEWWLWVITMSLILSIPFTLVTFTT